MIKRALLTGLGSKYLDCSKKRLSDGSYFRFDRLDLFTDLSLLSDRLKNAATEEWTSIDHIDDLTTSELPTKRNIKAAVDEILQKTPATDVFLFYFSGHGLAIDNATCKLVNYDEEYFESESLKSNSRGLISTNDYTGFLNEWLGAYRNLTFITVIDACYAGGLILPLDDTSKNQRHLVFCSVSKYDPAIANKFTPALCITTSGNSYQQQYAALNQLNPKPQITIPQHFLSTISHF